ncbi:metallophosphoesterase [Corynebacterium hindlerae]|uniref:Metallophosphoesterase n=1 Tax=Corynebacterium hindlerae TaxID=699041 RepID=A0A7G5FIC9_9CORY|nr:metallophosphoesterase [Corynebacterium hindlerae]QMV86370.1 metallophosphoesterase [Corynebacterium hindlerae]
MEPEYTPKTEFDGVSGFIQTGPRGEVTDADHADILRECGYDPSKVRIVGNPRISRWQRFDGEWLSAYRFHIESTESIPAWNLDELIEVAKAASFKQCLKEPGDGTIRVLQVGDLQLGKRENGPDGIGDLLKRYMRTLDAFVETIQPGQPVLVAHVGDCIEGIVSQGGKNQGYQTPLTGTEMVRVYRRLLMETVTTIAPHTNELVVAVVNGNHDEAQRQLNTKPGDGWATESAIAVKDALELAGGYEHVRVVVPPERQGHLTTKVGNTIFTIMHGHQLPRPGGCAGAEKWLKDAAFYQQPAAGAHFVLFGHFHQFQALTSGPRTFLCSNTYDGGSDWFAEHNGGAWQQPFATAFTTHGGQLLDLQPI